MYSYFKKYVNQEKDNAYKSDNHICNVYITGNF